jgi:hypothetical protein
VGHITRMELLVFRDGCCWLLQDRRGAWHLPAAHTAAGAHTGQLALALLKLLGLARPGQRVWLLGLWPPVAVYLALLPDGAADLTTSASAGDWWPPAEAAALVAAKDAERILRAAAWLADGGASRRGIA